MASVIEGGRFTEPGPPGAGRWVDLTWPQMDNFQETGATGGIANLRGRIAAGNYLQGVITVNTNGNMGFNSNINGRNGFSVGAIAAGAPNGIEHKFQGYTCRPALFGTGVAPLPPNLDGLDVLRCFRTIMIASFINPATPVPLNVDNGISFSLPGNVTFDDLMCFRQQTGGLGFRMSDVSTLEAFYRANQAGALTRVTVKGPGSGFQPGDWHAYELRIIGARGSTPAIAKWLIDGQLVLARRWDAPGMPFSTAAPLRNGFKVAVASNGGNAFGFTVYQVAFHAGPTEESLF